MSRNAPHKFDETLLKPDEECIDAGRIRQLVEAAKEESNKMVKQRDALLHLVRCIDLTSLNATDTPDTVCRLASRACNPLPGDDGVRCAAVCVYPLLAHHAVEMMKQKKENKEASVNVACVAGAFPSGLYHLKSRQMEVQLCVEDGVDEIDIVLNRGLALREQWLDVYEEVRLMRSACGDRAHLKVILATGELQEPALIYKAAMCCMLAGADFIKTSTGKEKVNATLEAAVVMCQAIKKFYDRTGIQVGFKPAGGIRLPTDALAYQSVAGNVCGVEWTPAGRGGHLFRIGASSLLDEVIALLG